ncbi:MAG: ABC transporter, permease protein [Rhodanobacteraceae bacterium]|jgi:putative ABC transport system permease protein|nr:MAG: ABC transporter, permease protein [Rhodanobacteraceae bacterium]
MHLHPLLRSLTRHKLTVALMLLATALTCAIVTNIASMVVHRLVLLDAPSGMDEDSLVMFTSARIKATDGGRADHDFNAQYTADLVALRGIPGVRSDVAVMGLPMWGGYGIDISSNAGTVQEQGFQATAFPGGPGLLRTLGLNLLVGRDFLSSEYVPYKAMKTVSAAIISRTLAQRLFQTDDAVGRLFYTSNGPIRVVGVVAHLMGMSPQLGASDNEYAMLLPVEPDGDYVTFVLHATPANRGRVLNQAVTLLSHRDPLRVFDNAETFAQARAQYFRRDSSMIGLLLAAGIGLLIVTAAGIAGLASFWVQQRTRSIGIRRAVGATRVDILCYFHAENFLIVTGGVLLGCVLAYALNLLLMKYYALQVLPLGYLLVGALTLWLIGQLAVLGPALRAAAVPPAVATRSV